MAFAIFGIYYTAISIFRYMLDFCQILILLCYLYLGITIYPFNDKTPI